MDFSLVNTRLLSHPVNWGIVWVTLLLASYAWALIHHKIMAPAPDSVAPD
jgi:hypothetical protein